MKTKLEYKELVNSKVRNASKKFSEYMDRIYSDRIKNNVRIFDRYSEYLNFAGFVGHYNDETDTPDTISTTLDNKQHIGSLGMVSSAPTAPEGVDYQKACDFAENLEKEVGTQFAEYMNLSRRMFDVSCSIREAIKASVFNIRKRHLNHGQTINNGNGEYIFVTGNTNPGIYQISIPDCSKLGIKRILADNVEIFKNDKNITNRIIALFCKDGKIPSNGSEFCFFDEDMIQSLKTMRIQAEYYIPKSLRYPQMGSVYDWSIYDYDHYLTDVEFYKCEITDVPVSISELDDGVISIAVKDLRYLPGFKNSGITVGFTPQDTDLRQVRIRYRNYMVSVGLNMRLTPYNVNTIKPDNIAIPEYTNFIITFLSSDTSGFNNTTPVPFPETTKDFIRTGAKYFEKDDKLESLAKKYKSFSDIVSPVVFTYSKYKDYDKELNEVFYRNLSYIFGRDKPFTRYDDIHDRKNIATCGNIIVDTNRVSYGLEAHDIQRS